MKCAGFVLGAALVAFAASAGPLENYVRMPDQRYRYTLAHMKTEPAYTIYVLDMTSQSWKAGKVVPAQWKHWLSICVPQNAVTDTGMLFIGGGSSEQTAPPRNMSSDLIRIATVTRSVVAVVEGVPNQPLRFADENRTRSEDASIAYTFDKFLQTGDATWPLLLPMVKSAVRAMDTVQDFGRNHAETPFHVNRFVLTGASKRGWTAWLTAATDRRVVALAPMVIDMLNLPAQMEQQIEYYGRYTESIGDYTAFDLQERLTEPNGERLVDIVDPYRYLRRLTMPKFVVLGAGDQYWTVDAASLYFDALRGPKYLYYAPNADHGLQSRQDVIQALTAFYDATIKGETLPQFTWEFSPGGEFRVEPRDAPLRANLWTALAPTKDFRLKTIGSAWQAQELPPGEDGVYAGTVAKPEEGFVAFYIQMVYRSPLGFEFALSTEMGLLE